MVLFDFHIILDFSSAAMYIISIYINLACGYILCICQNMKIDENQHSTADKLSVFPFNGSASGRSKLKSGSEINITLDKEPPGETLPTG